MPIAIQPSNIYYIKLGSGGGWEAECLSNGTIRLGYREIKHASCLEGAWDEVLQQCMSIRKSSGPATHDLKQIRTYYEATPNDLWVTFSKGSLWWAFAQSSVELHPDGDGSKIRHTLVPWQNLDIHGTLLLASRLSGQLLRVQAFRGTICKVGRFDYLVRKINALEDASVVLARQAMEHLEIRICDLVKMLWWPDFEILVDLIFRQAGWQRVSQLGEQIKDIDLELLSPITCDRFGVQVKAQSNLGEFRKYRDERLVNMQGFTRFFYVVHTPTPDLRAEALPVGEKVTLVMPEMLAKWAVERGLSEWIINKADS